MVDQIIESIKSSKQKCGSMYYLKGESTLWGLPI
jgi:hypothetical protein